MIMGIIKSLLEMDLYKFTMGSLYFAKFANCTARFKFKDRTSKINADDSFMERLNHELDELCELRFAKEELDYLFSLRFLKDKIGYREYLRGFQLDRSLIHAHSDHGILDIVTDEASVLQTSMFEIFVLAIVNEIYAENWMMHGDGKNWKADKIWKKQDETVEELRKAGFGFMEFGTRRRFSSVYQEKLVEKLKALPNCTGTSNVYLAMKYGMKPMGTMAHEILELCQSLKDVPISQSQKYLFRQWAEHYDGDLGIALSDNLGTAKFLKDFGRYEASLFSGIRHDSGDPFIWGRRMLEMYMNYGIDPKTKSFVFSDGLSIDLANRLNEEFKDHVKVSMGIGTALTNPFCPTNIVMKMVSANGRPVAKISNEPSKIMCEDDGYVKYLRYAIENF